MDRIIYILLFVKHRRELDPSDLDLILTPTDHLSPPSTTSRLSDSDTTSECELDCDGSGSARDRRVADGASISSVGSSSSPPPESEVCERRSRRDMSPQGRKRAAVMMDRDNRSPYNQPGNRKVCFHVRFFSSISCTYRKENTALYKENENQMIK